MKRFMGVALLLALAAFSSTLSAEDKKADPSGTWKWSAPGQNNTTREITLVLKLDGDKLTGHMLGRDNKENPIADATFKDNEVAFSITRERNNQKFTTKYKGKLDGDAIKGTSESERDGKTQSRDWEAKRDKK